MNQPIDVDKILAPIVGDNPAGEDLRYSPLYDEIKEARRADDDLPLGKWERELKRADWDKVISVAVAVLEARTKDLQISAWLTEALIVTEGFAGLALGLKIMNGLLMDFWEQVYPMIEDGDLDFRAAPIEFLNDRVATAIRQVPLTEPRVTPAYSWFKWKESRDVGYEADLRNEDGSINEDLRRAREERIAENKLKPEDFDIAILQSSEAFYEVLAENLATCGEELECFEKALDERFGPNAPNTADFSRAIQDCQQTAKRIIDKRIPKEKRKAETVAESEHPKEAGFVSRLFKKHWAVSGEGSSETDRSVSSSAPGEAVESMGDSVSSEDAMSATVTPAAAGRLSDSESMEAARYNEALQMMGTAGMKKALGQLLAAAHSAPSVRGRNRYRLLMARLCLEAGRPDLARPIVEELHALIQELQLERWESPLWIAEVLDTLYQCLTVGEPSDEDSSRAKDLFQRLCTTDVTKAMWYKS
jgi:type VI secretion system protein ImpA